jgi:hypothetical protein
MTQDFLKSILRYDRMTGTFHWRVRAARNVFPGDAAGNNFTYGYVRILIGGKKYAAHRLVWMYFHGRWPTAGIDHRDHNTGNNRRSNLREATPMQNNQNRSRCAKPVNRKGRYHAELMVAGITHRLGVYDTELEAAAVITKARQKLHPFSN